MYGSGLSHELLLPKKSVIDPKTPKTPKTPALTPDELQYLFVQKSNLIEQLSSSEFVVFESAIRPSARK